MLIRIVYLLSSQRLPKVPTALFTHFQHITTISRKFQAIEVYLIFISLFPATLLSESVYSPWRVSSWCSRAQNEPTQIHCHRKYSHSRHFTYSIFVYVAFHLRFGVVLGAECVLYVHRIDGMVRLCCQFFFLFLYFLSKEMFAYMQRAVTISLFMSTHFFFVFFSKFQRFQIRDKRGQNGTYYMPSINSDNSKGTEKRTLERRK